MSVPGEIGFCGLRVCEPLALGACGPVAGFFGAAGATAAGGDGGGATVLFSTGGVAGARGMMRGAGASGVGVGVAVGAGVGAASADGVGLDVLAAGVEGVGVAIAGGEASAGEAVGVSAAGTDGLGVGIGVSAAGADGAAVAGGSCAGSVWDSAWPDVRNKAKVTDAIVCQNIGISASAVDIRPPNSHGLAPKMWPTRARWRSQRISRATAILSIRKNLDVERKRTKKELAC